jgi:hypothetical protein
MRQKQGLMMAERDQRKAVSQGRELLTWRWRLKVMMQFQIEEKQK